MTMYTDDNRRNKGTDSLQNYVQAVLDRLPGHPPRVEPSVDVHGRFWLQDTENEEAYLWTRDTVDVEAAR